MHSAYCLLIMSQSVRKSVSGGQTGVDRAALDFAIEVGLDFGGFVPKGRLDKSGKIAERYSRLVEAPSHEPPVRTSLNVCASDGTALFSRREPFGGTALTAQLAALLERPLVHIDSSRLSRADAVGAVAHRASHCCVGRRRTETIGRRSRLR
jgi:hypothetical protein